MTSPTHKRPNTSTEVKSMTDQPAHEPVDIARERARDEANGLFRPLSWYEKRAAKKDAQTAKKATQGAATPVADPDIQNNAPRRSRPKPVAALEAEVAPKPNLREFKPTPEEEQKFRDANYLGPWGLEHPGLLNGREFTARVDEECGIYSPMLFIEYDPLVRDMGLNGYPGHMPPILMDGELIIDGHNRWCAAQDAGLALKSYRQGSPRRDAQVMDCSGMSQEEKRLTAIRLECATQAF